MAVNLPLALCASAMVFFVAGWRRLRRRRQAYARWSSFALFGVAVFTCAVTLAPPFDELADRKLLAAHMLQHMIIVDIAPALMLLAIRGPLAFFILPRSLLRALSRTRVARSILKRLLTPTLSFLFWAVALVAWHVPVAYEYALKHELAHDLEHATFFSVGVFVWFQLIDPVGRSPLTIGGRRNLALLVFLVAAVISAWLMFSAELLYASYASTHSRPFALTAVADQRLAGLVMLCEQGAMLGLCLAWLRHEASSRRRQVRLTAALGGQLGG